MPEELSQAWFGLLGPLRVRDGGAEVVVPAARQRVLLAALLIRVGQVVSVDELAAAVWDGEPPTGARVTLRSYVKRLRRVLGPAAGSRIIARDPGYLINAGDDEVDLKRFEALCCAGGRASAAGAWREASDLLCQALGLWRGAPLADVRSQMLRYLEVPRLEQLRLQAYEWQIEADLNLGDHGQLVPRLQALVAEHPLRERFHAQLMLALYLSGRQAEALAAYRQARGILVGELGIEPGPDLREMHQRVLAGARGLAAHAPAATRRAPAIVPRQLPVATRYFTGRSTELNALTELLDHGSLNGRAVVISAIGGTAGVGKTALAVHWAHQVVKRFPDGQLYVNLRGFDPAGRPVPAAEAVRGFLDAFGLPPERIPPGLEAQIGLYRSLVADRRVLIVLDNASDAGQVRPLLAGSPDCVTVVTSRNQLTSLAVTEGADLLTLDLLTQADASDLLACRLGAGRLADEADAAARMIALCAGLPLALSIVAARAAARPAIPLARLAEELGDPRGRLDVLHAGDPSVGVRGVFSWSYLSLSEDAARMFRLLGLHPGPDVSVRAAASLAGLSPRNARRMLDELASAHLVTEHQNGRFVFHDLLRAFAAEQAHSDESEAERRSAVGRMLDYYTDAGWAAALLLNPRRDSPGPPVPPRPGTSSAGLVDYAGALAWFEAEERTLLGAITQAADTGFEANAWRIAWSLADHLDRRGHLSEWAAAQRTAVAAATRLGDLVVQAYTHRGLGRASTELGLYHDADSSFRRALDLYRQLGDRHGEAHTHLGLARVYEFLGQYREALDQAGHGLALFHESDDSVGLAKALNATGWYDAHMSNYRRALGRCAQALDLYRKVGDRRGEATTRDSLGYVHHHLGDHPGALASYQEALEIFVEIGDRHNQAATLTRMGDTYEAAAESRAAREAWEQALAILDDLDHPSAGQVRIKLLALGT